MSLIIVPLARHVASDPVTRGAFINAFEAIVLFIRDEVARPAIGGHGADEFLPYLWTVFFFVLFNNLLGMIPGGASATGNINVTVVLAVIDARRGDLRGDARSRGRSGSGSSSCRTLDVPALDQAGPLAPVVRDRGRRAC